VSKQFLFLDVLENVPNSKNVTRKVEEQPASESQSADCKSKGFRLGDRAAIPFSIWFVFEECV
jgi:hypothetical protein